MSTQRNARPARDIAWLTSSESTILLGATSQVPIRLDPVGTVLWKELIDLKGGRLVDVAASRFDVPPSAIEPAVDQFLGALAELGVVEL